MIITKEFTKKLIEVAMPLKEINNESAWEKSVPRRGHPSTLHIWWSRKPLATARAVLFASLVDDPSEHENEFPTKKEQDAERQRLFDLIGELVKWENSGDEKLFAQALDEIKKSCGDDLPAVFDPFTGGGTIPLEAQRLGLETIAFDYNPVAVMINKAMIELPAQFKNHPPVNPTADKNRYGGWHGAEGLAEDILYYGKLLKSLAFKKLGKLYPQVHDDEHNIDRTVIAWLWARNVTCSNPACRHRMPLVSSFKLSTKRKIFVEPIIEGDKIRFEIRQGDNAPEGTVDRNGARCIFCGTHNSLDHVRAQAKAGDMSAQMIAIVAEKPSRSKKTIGKIYLAPDEKHEQIADVDKPNDFPEGELADDPRNLWTKPYGLDEWHKLFTNRQLTALTTFNDLIGEIQRQIIEDGGDKNYSDALAVYLSFLIDKLADYSSTLCSWQTNEQIAHVFSRQAIPMIWDYSEGNFFSNSSGCFDNMLKWIYDNVKELSAKVIGTVERHSVLKKFSFDKPVMVSTDPPYYDNISYADLSEFFYVWMRRSLKNIYPQLFGRMTFDKDEELIATPYRHGSDQNAAKKFFEDGMFQALQNIHDCANVKYPVTIYYAYKQRESDDGASTGWETMLNAIIRAGFQITATWPMRTERSVRTNALDTNSLASSVVLVCRKRPPENKFMSKNDFLRTLKAELPEKLHEITNANIAPLDLAQAAIGPGIAVYSRYEKIADMTDTPLTVRDALKIINDALNEYIDQLKIDAASQVCLTLFEQKDFGKITFGEVDVLARAKNISVDDLARIGAVESSKGIVRLKKRDEIPVVVGDKQLNREWLKNLVGGNCAWLWVQSLVIAMKKIGVEGCGELLAKYDGELEPLKNLIYQLYNICAKKSSSKEKTAAFNEEAKDYNNIVAEWQDILSKRENYTKTISEPAPVQGTLGI